MAGAECKGGMERYCKMKGRNYSLLPGELKDCLLHCGFCKKQDLSQNFEKGKEDYFYKCPHCGKFNRRVYESKAEREHDLPIRERNRQNYLSKPKPDLSDKPYIKRVTKKYK